MLIGSVIHNRRYVCFIITVCLITVYFIIGGMLIGGMLIGSVIHNRRYVCFIITSMLNNSILHNRWYANRECDS